MLTAAATSSLAMESDPSAMPFTISPRISSVSSGKSSAASSGISSGIVSYYRAVPSIDYRAVSEMQFTHLDRYLRAYLAKESPNSRSTARQKLTRLTIQQFHELSTDVHDELHRRKNEKEVPFLPVDEKFHPKRNQARQKLATLPTTRFQDLASDVHFELARRYPGFKENLSGLVGPGSNNDDYPVSDVPDNSSPRTDRTSAAAVEGPQRESFNSLDELLGQQTELDKSIAALRLFSPPPTSPRTDRTSAAAVEGPQRESFNSFEELLRQQTELDKSIAALRLFSPPPTLAAVPLPPPEHRPDLVSSRNRRASEDRRSKEDHDWPTDVGPVVDDTFRADDISYPSSSSSRRRPAHTTDVLWDWSGDVDHAVAEILRVVGNAVKISRSVPLGNDSIPFAFPLFLSNASSQNDFLRDIPRVTIPDEYSRHANSQHRLWFIWYLWHHLTGTRRRPPWMDIVCGADVDGRLWLLQDEDEECIKEFVIYLAVYYSFGVVPAQMPMVDWNDASRALDARLSQTMPPSQLVHLAPKTRLRLIAWLVVAGPLRKDRILRDEGVPTIERLIHNWAMSMGLFRDAAETCEICSVSHLLPIWIETLMGIYSVEDLGSLPWGQCDCLESHLAVARASITWSRRNVTEPQVRNSSLMLRMLYELVVPRWPLVLWVAFRTVMGDPADRGAFLDVLRDPDQDLFNWDVDDDSELYRVLAKENMYTQDWSRHMLELDLQDWLRIGSTTRIAHRIRHRSDDVKIRLLALFLRQSFAPIATQNILVRRDINVDNLFTSKPTAIQNILAPLNVTLNNFLFASMMSAVAEDYHGRPALADLESVAFWASSNLETWLLTQSEKLCRTVWHSSPRSSLSRRVQDMYLAFNRLPRNLAMYTYSLVQQSDRHGEPIEFPDIADQWESGFLISLTHYCATVKKLLNLIKQCLQTRTFSTNDTIAITVCEHMNRDLSAVVARLVLFLRDSESYKKFLSCSGTDAQRLLDLLQDLLDLDAFSVVKPTIFQALLRLSRPSGVHPRCFALSGLQKVGQQVTGGSFGDIWKGLVRGQSVCVKVMRVFEDSDIEDALKEFGREALIWRQLCHPNVLPFFGVYYLDDRPCLVSPWMEDGHIMKFLKTQAPDDAERFSLILDVAQGLQYLHEQKIVHGDLKGLNILVTPSRRACIADFGVSTIANAMTVRFTHSTGTSRGGTSRYLAPELFRMENPAQIHTGSDVYALACVCYEILTGKVPFHELPNDMAVMMRVAGGYRPPRLASCSGTMALDGLWELIQKCWAGQVEMRPTTPEIVKSLSGPLIGARTKPLATDWDEGSTSKFRRSLQAEPLLPSVAQMEHMLFGDHIAQH